MRSFLCFSNYCLALTFHVFAIPGLGFDGWTAFVDRQRRIHKSMALLRNSTLAKATHAWTEWLEMHLVKRSKLQSAVQMMTNVYASKAFRTWSVWLVVVTRQAGLLRQAAVRMHHRLLASGFAQWKGVALAMILLMVILLCNIMLTLSSVFFVATGLQDELHNQRREKLVVAVERMRRCAGAMALRTWVEFAAAA